VSFFQVFTATRPGTLRSHRNGIVSRPYSAMSHFAPNESIHELLSLYPCCSVRKFLAKKCRLITDHKPSRCTAEGVLHGRRRSFWLGTRKYC